MSAPYVSFTYFWNWLTISLVAEYVQLPTLSEPSAAIAALISSSVMSLLTIATCSCRLSRCRRGHRSTVPPLLATGALAGALAPPPVEGDAPLVHALATIRTNPASAPIVPNLLLRSPSSIRRTLLSGRPAPPRATPRTWR